jgi:glycosyltransferase involved in cell wall biosynthesis
MIYIDLPTGGHHGWGICGDNLSQALRALAPIERLVRMPKLPVPGPLLQSVGSQLRPDHAGLAAARRVGYAVFENDVMARRIASDTLRGLDFVATACRWCEDALRDAGLTSVATILHGVDADRFNPGRAIRRRHHDRFVIYSGGKFEFRKGQDVVVRAFQAFAERHPDALLVANWHNLGPRSAGTMLASPYWPFNAADGEPVGDSLHRWLAKTGVDLRRVELVPPLPNEELARVYGESDVGLFPNRCEGATNLVLMEYMACGRAAVCTDFSGHRDILNDTNSLPLRGCRPRLVFDSDRSPVACWCEPDIEETVERLEEAYRDRKRLADLGQRAAADMAEWTWDRAARSFLKLLMPVTPALAG